MSSTGSLQADPLFVGLTRPPMIFGVSYLFAGMNAFGCMAYFINTSNLSAFLMMIAFHLVGYVICFKEPLFLELFMIKMQKCNLCKNRMFHGANSYDVY